MRSQTEVALLSNGSYNVMVTSAGAGYSSWGDLDVTRWREDVGRRPIPRARAWSSDSGVQPVGDVAVTSQRTSLKLPKRRFL